MQLGIRSPLRYTANLAFVQSAGSSPAASGSSYSRAFPNNVVVGNSIICGLTWGSAPGGNPEALTSFADNLGNTYTRQNQGSIGSGCDKADTTNNQQHTIFSADVIFGGACTITATFLASRTNIALVICEYQGASQVDQTVANFQTSPTTGTDAVTSTAKTTVFTPELVVGIYTDTTAGNGTTVTAGTNFTKRVDTGGLGSSAAQIVIEDLIQAAAGSIAATFTESTNHRALDSMATFRGA